MPEQPPPLLPSRPREETLVPGYAQGVQPADPATGQAIRLFLLYGAVVLSFDQLLIVQPKLYLSPLGSRYENLFRAVGLGLFLVGILASRFWAKPSRSPFPTLLLSGALIALSGLGRFFAFDGPLFHAHAASGVAATALLTLGFALHRVLPTVRRWLKRNDGTFVYVQPFAVAGSVVALVTVSILSNMVGTLRSGLCVGGALTAAALLTLLDEPLRPPKRVALGLGYSLLLALGVAALWVESFCPLRRVLASSHPLIYTARTERISVDVTIGQGGLHYFVNGELRFSSVDEQRWAESLVLPAMMRIPRPTHALVLSQGEGLIERELLGASNTVQVTSVMRDTLLAGSARRQAYLRRLTRGSMLSRRVTLVERDPAAFALQLGDERYDVIIVDLPDPSGPLEVKYYSHLFYEQLATHLDSAGVLVVQATSARRSPRSFATIGATLAATGLRTVPLMVPLIARGEWSLYLCTHGDLPRVVDIERYRKTFPGSFEAQMMSPWPDTLPPKDFVAKPSTLHDSVIWQWFEYEAESTEHG